MGIGIALAIIALLGVLAFIRLAPSDPDVWHVSPLVVTDAIRTREWLVAPGGDVPPVVLVMPANETADSLAAIAIATPRTQLLAGQGLHTTWITRSAIMGYPDYTSVIITPTATGSEITIFARARFGHSDFGVNRARVESWLKQLE